MAIISVGGLLGVDQRYVAVRPSTVGIGYDASTRKWWALMNAAADQLKAAPEFGYGARWSSGLV